MSAEPATAAWAIPPTPAAAQRIFGDRLELAERYARLLAEDGVRSGVIGPREVPRLWERHLLNSAVLAELVPAHDRVLDVGSGAGLPGIPLAVARPDLDVVLVEPLARRVRFLHRCAEMLPGVFHVEHARAEALHGRQTAPTVVARAVAPLERLAAWCVPLLAADGRLLAVKGSSAPAEVQRAAAAVRAAGGDDVQVVRCGVGVVDPPTTVIVVTTPPARDRGRRIP